MTELQVMNMNELKRCYETCYDLNEIIKSVVNDRTSIGVMEALVGILWQEARRKDQLDGFALFRRYEHPEGKETRQSCVLVHGCVLIPPVRSAG